MRTTETQGHRDIEELNKITGLILNASIEVHKNLGPGLLESVYEICLFKELSLRGLNVQRQVFIPVTYKNEILNLDFRIDILVENEIVVELKSCEALAPVHEAQVLTYLKLSNKRIGLLINFNEVLLKNGFKRLINGY